LKPVVPAVLFTAVFKPLAVIFFTLSLPTRPPLLLLSSPGSGGGFLALISRLLHLLRPIFEEDLAPAVRDVWRLLVGSKTLGFAWIRPFFSVT